MIHFFIKHHATILYNSFFIWKLGDYSRYIFLLNITQWFFIWELGDLFTICFLFESWVIDYLQFKTITGDT